MTCRSGCATQDHGSYAECLQSANVTISATTVSRFASAYEKTKQDLAAYRTARANGIQPEGTTVEKVRAAERASKLMGEPYNAHAMPPASMVVNKATAKIAKASA